MTSYSRGELPLCSARTLRRLARAPRTAPLAPLVSVATFRRRRYLWDQEGTSNETFIAVYTALGFVAAYALFVQWNAFR